MALKPFLAGEMKSFMAGHPKQYTLNPEQSTLRPDAGYHLKFAGGELEAAKKGHERNFRTAESKHDKIMVGNFVDAVLAKIISKELSIDTQGSVAARGVTPNPPP